MNEQSTKRTFTEILEYTESSARFINIELHALESKINGATPMTMMQNPKTHHEASGIMGQMEILADVLNDIQFRLGTLNHQIGHRSDEGPVVKSVGLYTEYQGGRL